MKRESGKLVSADSREVEIIRMVGLDGVVFAWLDIEGPQPWIDVEWSACDHKDAKRVARSNTGNYDPSADCYWYEFTCRCGHRWTEDQ